MLAVAFVYSCKKETEDTPVKPTPVVVDITPQIYEYVKGAWGSCVPTQSVTYFKYTFKTDTLQVNEFTFLGLDTANNPKYQQKQYEYRYTLEKLSANMVKATTFSDPNTVVKWIQFEIKGDNRLYLYDQAYCK